MNVEKMEGLQISLAALIAQKSDSKIQFSSITAEDTYLALGTAMNLTLRPKNRSVAQALA